MTTLVRNTGSLFPALRDSGNLDQPLYDDLMTDLSTLVARAGATFALTDTLIDQQRAREAGSIDDPDSYDADGLKVGPLAEDAILTLSTTGAQDGDAWTITRTAASTGPGMLSVAGLKDLATGTWCRVIYKAGSGWYLAQYGAL